MLGGLFLGVYLLVVLIVTGELQDENNAIVFALKSFADKKLAVAHQQSKEALSNCGDPAAFSEILSQSGNECGAVFEKLSSYHNSCIAHNPLKSIDQFISLGSTAVNNCEETVGKLKKLCCSKLGTRLQSHCRIFFGSSGCSSTFKNNVFKHDENQKINFVEHAHQTVVEEPAPVAKCMSQCGCKSDKKCSGSSFNVDTCCDKNKFVSNECINCSVCELEIDECNLFPSTKPDKKTEAPTIKPDSTTPPNPTIKPTIQLPTHRGGNLMSELLTKDQLCDMFGVQRWWYPPGEPKFDPSNCHEKNYTNCKPPDAFWGSYGPEGRFLDFWDTSGYSGATSWTRENDREECLKAVELLLKHLDDAIKLVKKINLDTFSKLFNNGNEGIDRLEVAAFWAHVSVETGGLADFIESVTDPKQASNYGKYYGRGPLQLSYQSNYKAFSDFIGDSSIMTNPDKLINDPVIMWASALWFWMHETTFDVWSNPDAIGKCPVAHKSSMHWAITSGPGFGLSIAILNGAVECNPYNVQGGQKRWEKMNSRVRNLLWNMHIMKIAAPTTPGLIIDKKNEKEFWTAPYVALPDWFTEGCPPIHEGKDKLKCKGQLQKFGYDKTKYGHDDLTRGPLYAGWNGGNNPLDMHFKTMFDAPFPWVSSLNALGYIERTQKCEGVLQTIYSGGHYTCTSNICAADPKKHLWILKSTMRYQCDNTPTGNSLPSSCPTKHAKWPEGKWKTTSSEWPNTFLEGNWKAPEENYVDDQYSTGTGNLGQGELLNGGLAKNPRTLSDFKKKKKIRDIVKEDDICDMFGTTRWWYPNGLVNSQVCDMCGPRNLFPHQMPPLRIEDIYIAKKICKKAAVPLTGKYTKLSDLWHICRESADNSLRKNGVVESEYGSYGAEGQYTYQYGRFQQNKEPWSNMNRNIDVLTFLKNYWNRTNDRQLCHIAAKYVLDDIDSGLTEVRIRSPRFDSIFDNGNDILDRIEVAAFLAHVNKETNLYEWVESVNSHETEKYKNGNIMCDPNSEYKCVKDVWYNGRGPLQITWNYNYGKFSKFWNDNQNIFLKDPEMLVKDPTIGWGSAFWFWLEEHEFDVWSHTMGTNVCPLPHKGSMHDAITRSVGFGLSIAIINGQAECSPYNGDYQRKSMALARLRYFVFNLWVLKVPLPPQIIFDTNKFWNEEFVAMPKYFYEGCPSIGIDAKKGNNRSCIPKCKAFQQKLGFQQGEEICVAEYKPGDKIKGCPTCSTANLNAQLLGAVHCGFNLNDPNNYQFELPWPSVGSLEALNYSPGGYAYCQLMTGKHKELEYYFPRVFSGDCNLQDGMCIVAKDGKTIVGKYTRPNKNGEVVLSINIEECKPGSTYCCYDNSHTHLMKFSKLKYSENVLWHPEPLLRFQCDHCPDKCDGGPCETPEKTSCPTGRCGKFNPYWPQGSWRYNDAEWPGTILVY